MRAGYSARRRPATGDVYKRQGHGVENVGRFGVGPLAIEVDQNYLAADAVHHHRIGGRRTDKAAANDSDFHLLLLWAAPLAGRAGGVAHDRGDKYTIRGDSNR